MSGITICSFSFAICVFLSRPPTTNCILSVGTSKIRNGASYTLTNLALPWSTALITCLPGTSLLWFEDLEEVKWLKTAFDLSDSNDLWTAGEYGKTAWPNGASYPADLPPQDENKRCLEIDISNPRYRWKECYGDRVIICKTSARHVCSKLGPHKFRQMATGRYQKGEQLRNSVQSSRTACAALCARVQLCCAFEYNSQTKACTLLAYLNRALWIAKAGSTIFEAEG